MCIGDRLGNSQGQVSAIDVTPSPKGKVADLRVAGRGGLMDMAENGAGLPGILHTVNSGSLPMTTCFVLISPPFPVSAINLGYTIINMATNILLYSVVMF